MQVHLILNSHLDPVWLWTWQQGVDEVLATARTACELLDEYPEIVITRGEAWFYATVQEYDPPLFKRIKRHVTSGRLQPVGGWWIQPDCNIPSATAFLQQGRIAQEYFRTQLKSKVTVGYNVDSFGHAATLPDFYRAAGIDSYVMMRPQEHEMTLPGNLFTWKSPKGNELTTFRISRSYCTTGSLDRIADNIEATLAAANEDVGHTMCFVGIGDHGGGPARQEIEWLKKHMDYRRGVKLVFSHPRAFFDAVKKSGVKLPVVKGELQHHAVGCYSVVHRIKQEVRQTEDILEQAENLGKAYPQLTPPDFRPALDTAWRHLLFNQFHDILAGSSIRNAYGHAYEELGAARATARRQLVYMTRQLQGQLKSNSAQQLLFVNTSDRPFAGYVDFEPWIGYLWCDPAKPLVWRLADEDGASLPAQTSPPEAAFNLFHLTARLTIPAGGMKTVRLLHDRSEKITTGVKATARGLSNGELNVKTTPDGIASLTLDKRQYLDEPPRVAVIEDVSDTWSHGIAGYAATALGEFGSTEPWHIGEQGPLLASNRRTMHFEHSSVLWENLVYHDENILRIRLRLNWSGLRRIVKLVIRPAFTVTRRIDGIPGDKLERKLNGEEYPIQNYTVLAGSEAALAVVSRDIFAADVQPDGTLRLTLLRSPYYAHHDPFKVDPQDNYPVCDHGEHEYAISLLPMKKVSFKTIEAEVQRQSAPVWFTESTRGCTRGQ